MIVNNPFLSQIIYPLEGLSSIDQHAFLIGWNIEQFRCCISCVIVLPIEHYDILKDALVTISLSPDLKEIFQTCSSSGLPPVILGEWIPDIKSNHIPLQSMQEAGIWITLTRNDNNYDINDSIEIDKLNNNDDKYKRNDYDNGKKGHIVGIGSAVSSAALFFSPYQWGIQKHPMRPKLHSIYSLGCSYTTSCYMIEFDSIDTDKLCCLQLEAIHKPYEYIRRKSDIGHTSQSPASSPRNSNNVDVNSFSHRRAMSNVGIEETLDMDLHFITAQINASHDLKEAIYSHLVQRKVIDDTGLSDSEHNLYNLSDRFSLSLMWTPVTWTFLIVSSIWFKLVTLMRRIVEAEQYILMLFWPLAYVLGIRAPNIESTQIKQKGLSLCDLSFLAVHLSKRFEAIENSLYLCAQFPRSWKLAASKRQFLWLNVCSHAALISIDLMLGFLFGYIILKNSKQLMDFSEKMCIGLEGRLLMDSLRWFNHSPVGIKLNPLITKKMGNILRWALRNYGKFMVWTKPVHIHIVRLIACTGSMGITIQLAAIIDVVRVLSFHVAVLHRILAIQHHLQLSLISSLWNLFRGKKHNILRKRVDTCYYDRYQLLCGTILFAISFFLLPSFAAYFYLFTLSQLIIVSFQVVLWSFVVIIKDYPFYTFACHLWDPQNFTFGVQFQLIQSGNDSNDAKKSIGNSPLASPYHSSSHLATESKFHKMDGQSPIQMVRKSLREDIGRRDVERRRILTDNLVTPNTSLPLLRSFQGKNSSTPKANINLLTPSSVDSSNTDNQVMSSTDIKETGDTFRKSLSESLKNYDDHNLNSWQKISNLFKFRPLGNRIVEEDQSIVSITVKESSSTTDVDVVIRNEDDNYIKDNFHKPEHVVDVVDNDDEPWLSDTGLGLTLRKKEFLTKSLSRNSKQTSSLHSRFKRISRTGKALGMPLLSHLDINVGNRSLTPTGLSDHETIHLSISPRPLSYRNTFSAYVSHWNFFKKKHHFLYDLLQGIISGWPALDIQLIQVTMDLSSNSNQGYFHEAISLLSNEISTKNFWDEIRKASGAKVTESRSLSRIQLSLNWLLLQIVLITYTFSFLLFFGGVIVFITSILPNYNISSNLQFIIMMKKILKE